MLFQVKSANANGSVACTFAAPDLPFSVACGATEAATFSVGITFAFTPATVGAGVTPAALAATVDVAGLDEPGCEDAAPAARAAGELPVGSNSSTPFSSRFTRFRSPPW